MSQPRIRLYAAVSLDGFIADRSGRLDWFRPYESEDVGFEAFSRTVGTLLVGRGTYETAGPWPVAGLHTVVLTHRPLANAPAGVVSYAGDIAALARTLEGQGAGDIGILGGAQVARHVLDRGLVDRIELHLVPVLLGGGVRLFAAGESIRTLAFSEARSLPNGIVGLFYDLGPRLRAI